jgi:hypothetical protein
VKSLGWNTAAESPTQGVTTGSLSLVLPAFEVGVGWGGFGDAV